MLWEASESERTVWCAPTARARVQRIVLEVHGDHLGGCGGPCDLDADVTESADTDDHDGGIRSQFGPGIGGSRDTASGRRR